MTLADAQLSSLHLKVLRCHAPGGTIDARIVHCAEPSDGDDGEPGRIWVIESARAQTEPDAEGLEAAKGAEAEGTAPVWYIRSPKVIALAAVRKGLEEGLYSLAEFEPPQRARYNDEELLAGRTPDFLLRRSRARPVRWVARKTKNKEMIAPIVAHDDFALFEAGLLDELIAQRAKQLGLKTSARVRRLTLQFLLGGRQDWALLPNWEAAGGLGTSKVCKKKTGHPNIEAARHPRDSKERAAVGGYICSLVDRGKLRNGWKKFKKRGVSDKRAFALTNDEYYARSVQLVGTGKDAERKVELKHPNERPTLAEFQRHGPTEEDRAARINMGAQAFKMQHKGSYNAIRKSPVHLGVKAFIDSTSEDQTLVSEASRLKVIGTSHRTVVVAGGLGYILGVYSGLESPSTLTALMAIMNCIEDKQVFCKRHGRNIESGEWISFMPRGIFADNGELKSELGIATLVACDISLTFVRAYDPKPKQIVEHNHHKLHSEIDHDNEGSTEGRARERGEVALADEASLTHAEHMPLLIDAILWINNIEPVPHLLTMEMRRDGVKATRRAILEWMMANGYATSEPTNIEALRVRCLPKLRAVITRQGVEIFDPREGHTNLIPNLVYESAYLHESGLSDKAAKRRIPCEVHIDPCDISVVWLAGAGPLRRLDLCSPDPELCKVVLRDWLEICDDDALQLHLDREFRDNAYASRVSTQRRANKQAKNAKRKEAASLAASAAAESTNRKVGVDTSADSQPNPSDPQPTASASQPEQVGTRKGGAIRANRQQEIARVNGERLGLAGAPFATAQSAALPPAPAAAPPPALPIAQEAAEVDTLVDQSLKENPPADMSQGAAVDVSFKAVAPARASVMDLIRGTWTQ
ncbi:hypothetical protein ACSFBX_11200 [Variovorax sp. RB2P76]|uniref:hypothetical protein n=1 Tax=Variovorax sp. RB2P76 TaxID=3443736 RepID=UPI003F47BC5E